MTTLQVLEHQRLRIGERRSADELVLGDKEATLLERLLPALPAGICRWEHRAVRFTQHCGVICLGSTVIEVLPKIAGKEQEPGACRDALIGMLNESRELQPATAGNGPVRMQRAVLLDAFVLAFCRELEVQLAQGLLRQYVSHVENLPVIRGKLRVELQLKHNSVHRERLYCEYDELSPDMPLNRVIKGVLQRLSKLPLGARALKHVRELLLRFDGVADVVPSAKMLDAIVVNRTMARYESVLRQCRWFLEGIYPDVTVGANVAAALLFDMNKLFESCVTRAAQRIARGRGLRLHAQGPMKWFARDAATDKQLFAMKPDMTLSDADGTVLLVADAKWKLLDEAEAKWGVAEADMYQLAAYAARYGATQAALIYPKQSSFSVTRALGLHKPALRVQLVPFDVVTRSFHGLSV
ncbi:McrC family protein [Steroidobacter flavus]|uniref:McrC family protein n=1 Tax=Steroidobacter flavus TaxID=1842136 RepID=A0ABV8SQ98_9GAMM